LQLSVIVGSQVVHEPPPAPHAMTPIVVTHVWPEQQPSGQDVPSHMQLPPEQRCPLTHPVAPLHVQSPAVEQPLPLVPHTVHAPPSVPQLPATWGMHWLPEQHPSGHDAALHSHVPAAPDPTHAWPCGHALPFPHAHCPVDAEHPLALTPQVVHEPPLTPQATTEGVVHVCPEQHPLGHVVSLQSAHAPALQMRPMQSWHVAPPAPQAFSALPVSHVVPVLSQQPAHDWGSHTH
jgi:hypothetical protein